MKPAVIIVISALLTFCSASLANDLLVPSQYATIQSAIHAAVDGDTVIIAPGTYTGPGNRDIDFLGKAITVRSMDPEDPCVVAATVIDCNGTESEPHRGFYFHTGEGKNSILDGITITNGYTEWGGGIYCQSSSLIIKNCFIKENTATVGGGGIYSCSNTNISNCTFSGNFAYYQGGGVYIDHSPLTITGCIFTNNIAIGTVSSAGGAIQHNGGYSTVRNSLFVGNKSGGGGGVSNIESSPTFTNCTFSKNLATWVGGGIGNYSYSHPTLINCVFWANKDKNGTGESAQIYGSGPHNLSQIDYCCVQGWTGSLGGIGNFNIDPCFVDDTNDDYHLKSDSPCIDTGDPDYFPEPNETDLDGLPRVIGARIDMGAYEFNHQPVADAGPNQVAYAWIDGFADVNLDGSASFDDDNDILDFYWSWTIDGNTYEANGVSPIIHLPIGEHQITLIVDDGIDLSEPDYCTITVIRAVRGKLTISPKILHTKTCGKWIIATLFIPHVPGEQVNKNEPLRLYPSGIEAKYQRFHKYGMFRWSPTFAVAFFDKQMVSDTLGTGTTKVSVVGEFLSGRFFFGSDTIKIMSPKPKPPHYWHW